MVSRTGFSPTSTFSPDTADGSSRSTATGHQDPDLPPPGTADGSPRAAATGRINRCTRPVPPRRLRGRRWARDQALLPTCSPSPWSAAPGPIHWTKCLLYTARLLPRRRPSL